MPTAQEIAASRAAQEQEGTNRQPITDTGAREPDPHQTPINDATGTEGDFGPQDGGDGAGDQPQRQSRKPIYMSPSDEARANIAKRFKRGDDADVEFNGDPNDPAMLYGKVGRTEPEPEPEPAPQERQQQQQPEKKHTIKVRGKDIQLTEAELLERASKVEAADSYLAESRDLLEQVREVRRDNRERAPADTHRPEDRNNTQDDGATLDADGNPQHPGDELEAAIDEVRYGTDSKEAARKLDEAITKRAGKAAVDSQLQTLIGNDNTKSAEAMKAFIDANADLANDEDASRFMALKIFDLQREELVKLGVDEAKIPRSNFELAKMHQHWRVRGQPVSTQEQMLEAAKSRLQSWKGAPPTPQPERRVDASKPRIEVNVDRNARRAALPNQPTRTGNPPIQRQGQEPAQPRDRSSVIANMRKGRGQIVA